MHFKALCNRKGNVQLRPLVAASMGRNYFRFITQTLRVMRLTAIILLVSVLHVSATGVSQTVTVKVKNTPLEKLFEDVTAQTGYYFLYRPNQLKDAKPVTVTAEHLPVEQFLQHIFKNQPVTYLLQNQTVFIVAKADTTIVRRKRTANPGVTIKGEVRDSTGAAMRGASVQLYPGNQLATTDKNGAFILHDVAPGRYTLRVSYVGYETTNHPLVVAYEDINTVSLTLRTSASNLVEITVLNNGYQSIARERSAGSFSKPKLEVVNSRVTSMNLMQRLDGLVPGLVINNSPNTNGNGITVRGLSTINADKSLLYVVDGIVVTDLQDVNPNDVADVTMLKDATAASIWGSRASNGVIVVTTKRGNTAMSKLKVEYSGFYNFQGKPDLDYIPYMRSGQFVQTMKELISDSAYRAQNTWTSLNATLNGGAPIMPHEQILYRQYRGLISEATANAQLDSLAALDNLQQIKDTWYRNASLQNHTVSVRGGFGNYGLYASLAYTGNTSYVPGEKNNQYKLNVRQEVNISKKVSAYLITNLVNTITEAGRPASVTNRFVPYQLFKDADGNSIDMPWLYRSDSLRNVYQTRSGVNLNYNPIDEMGYGNTKGNTFRTNLTGGVTVKLVKGLRFEGVYGLMNGNAKTTNYDAAKSFTVRNQLAAFTVPAATAGGNPTYYLPITGGSMATSNVNQRNYTVRNQLAYDFKSGDEDHQLTMLAGQEATSTLINTNNSVARGYDPQLQTSQPVDYVTLGNGITGTTFPYSITNSKLSNDAYTENESIARTTSWYGNAAYTYLKKYTLNASIRNDKSNLFGKDRSAQYRPLWAVGLAWQMSREAFMENISWIDYLHMRATYGLSGNQPVASSVTAYDIYSGFANQNAYGGLSLSIASYANRKLSWESTQTYNGGFDYSILKGRVTGSFDAYLRLTSRLIGPTPANPFTGVATVTGNLGNIRNSGVEARINTINVRRKEFTWSSMLVFSYNKNKVTKLYVGTPTTSALSQIGIRYAEGYSAFAQWGYQFQGLDNLGDPLIQLADGTITKAPGALAKDLVYLGTFQPTVNGGFSNTFRYGNFQLSCNMVYNFGATLKRDVLGLNTVAGQLNGRFATNPGVFIGNLYSDFDNRWRKPGDEAITNIPSYVASSSVNSTRRNQAYYAQGDVNAFDGAYVKMRDVNLSYTVPAAIAKRMRAEDLTFRATLSNVLLWTANDYGIDPEFHNSPNGERNMPFAQKSIALGVNLRF